MHVFFYELALSLRRLVRRPTQTGLMLATFAVSITLTLLSWSLFHTIFLKNPGFDPHGELCLVGQTGPKAPGRYVGYSAYSSATREDYNAWKEQQTVFSEFTAVMLYNSIFVTTDNGVERLLSANVSAEAFRMVGAQPLLGRLFTADEDQRGCAPVILLSENTWRNRFGADPHIVGRTVLVDSIAATVVGVMPASFRFPNDQEMWQPLGFSPFERTPQVPVLDVIGRLKPGVTPARAAADLAQITARRGPATFAAQFGLQPIITPLREYYLAPELHQSSLLLFALSLVFVLVSCANAANLVMIEFFGRAPEIAASLALGIPRGAALRGLGFQLFAIALFAAAIGTSVLLLGAPLLHQALTLPNVPYWLTFSLEWHHLAVAFGLALLCAGVALLAPLAYLLWSRPEDLIRSGAGATRGTGRGWWRQSLMIAQVALLTVLAISAGLLLRSSRQLDERHWGFDAHRIFNAKTAMKRVDFPTQEKRLAAMRRMLDEIDRVPGVAAAGLMSGAVGYSGPPSGFYAATVDGLAEGRSQGGAQWCFVSPGIFSALGVNFIEGETFSVDEQPDAANYIVVNRSLAQKLWPGQSAVGRSLFVRNRDGQPMQFTIKGVVMDFQASGPKTTENDAIYCSFAKNCPAYGFVYVRGQTAPPALRDIAAAAHRADPRLPIYLPAVLQKVISDQLSTVRLTSQLTSLYAFASIILCALGVYSLSVAQVLQRTREFGIRLALGIEADRLWTRFAGRHLFVAMMGVALGLIAATAVVKLLASLLFGVEPHDALTFVGVPLLILAVAAAACVPSLFRLRRINPADCLRSL